MLRFLRMLMFAVGIEIHRKIKGADYTPTLRDERVPTQQELRRIFLSANSKARVACVDR